MSKKGNLYRVNDDYCRSCGLKLPDLPMCRITGTCIKCARQKLSRKVCEKCPDKKICDLELRGIEIYLDYERKISLIIIDLVPTIKDWIKEIVSKYIKIPNQIIEEISEKLTKTYLATTITLTNVKDPRIWLLKIFKPSTIKDIARTNIDVIKLSETLEYALKDYCTLIEVDENTCNIIKNILRYLVIKLITKLQTCKIIENVFNEYLSELFNNQVINLIR